MIPVSAPASDKSWQERFRYAVRHPIRWLDDMCGDGPVFALLVLFALNAVDELTRTAFGVLAPDIADDLAVGLSGISTVVALVGVVALGLTIPIANLADRHNRVWLASAGGMLLAFFAVGVGLAPNIWLLGIMLAGSGLGRAIIDPTHNSLLADYYPIETRPRIYSFHRAANAVGQFIGPLAAGWIAFYTSWRVPFFVFAPVILIAALLALRMKEPIRGARERAAMGASEEAVATEEAPPSMTEAWRMCWKVDSLRRIYRTLPFLAPAFVGFVFFASFLYADVFGLDERARGMVAALSEPAQIVGLIVGARIGTKLFAKDPSLVFRFIGLTTIVTSVATAAFALAPNVGVAVAMNVIITGSLAFVLPGVLAALSLAIPPRARAMGFSMGSVFVIPGLVALPLIGAIGDAYGVRTGLLMMTPMFLIGGIAIQSAGHLIERDIKNVWTTAAAMSEVVYERRQGRSKLLLVRSLDVAYGDVQVLFDVDLEADEGEIVALLGTNGAGKSTLLKAISGVVEADKGAVIFDGRDVTHAPPHEIAGHGIVQVPGGGGVFPSLTVRENLGTAGWLDRRNKRLVAERIDQVLDTFPILRERLTEPSANLSGGQQQMLALGMAFLSRPRLIMIDELSLGLAPVVVEQLLDIVRAMAADGTTVIVVEQSVNVALTLAERAYFMEKGEVRFEGPTADLLERPDVLRSVFLEGVGVDSDGNGSGDPVSVGPSRPQAQQGQQSAESQAEPAGDSVLELRGITRSFGGIRAVDDVSLSVAPGEVLGVIGPNGAGKTTLFDIVSGFIPADRGSVFLGGRDVSHLRADGRARMGLGRSFQDAALFPALTVEQTIAVALERWISVRDPIQAALHLPAVFDSEEQVSTRVDELIDLLGLEAFRSKFVHELSTGSRRIVDLACLVAHRPTVILLDEPSSGIAQRETEALAPVLLRIREQLGASLLVIEHDMPLVTAVADRLLALDQGRVVTDGPSDEVLHHPQVVASYLGTTEAVIARSGAID